MSTCDHTAQATFVQPALGILPASLVFDAVAVEDETKACKKCGETKPRDMFHNSVNTKDGKNSWCKACIKIKNTKWKEDNRDKYLDRKRKHYRHHAAKILEKQAGLRKTDRYKARMGPYRQLWQLAKRYGITIQEYEELVKRTGFRCEICGVELVTTGRAANRACVDHNHGTGKVRGILCRLCNQGLGSFKDSPEMLKLAAAYLERRGSVHDPRENQMETQP